MLKKWLIFLMAVICLTSCSEQQKKRQADFKQWIEPNQKIKVLSTTAMIDDLVKNIGGEHVDTITLIQGELDPHSYQLVKGDDEKLSFAELIFYSGLGLEHGPSLQQYLSSNSNAVSLGDWIHQEYPDRIIYINGQKDPHIWMDIALWQKTIPLIVKTLSEKDPSHQAYYQANAEVLTKKMLEVNDQVKNIMHQVPADKRFMVTSHDAFNYFTRAYLAEESELANDTWQKRFDAPEGLAPESQLSATNIRQIIDHLKKYQIQLIFPESNISRDSINKIVQAARDQKIDVKIACCPLYGDAMGEPGSSGDTYLKMILYNAKTLAGHMEPSLKNSIDYEHKQTNSP